MMKAGPFCMLVDAHCHLAGKHLDEQKLAQVIGRAQDVGVMGMIVVSTDAEDAPQVLKLVAERPRVLQASVGCHPHEAKQWDDGLMSNLRQWVADPHVRFVGETGLDGHYDFSPMEDQKKVFRHHIRLAKDVGKPLMIHTREAGEETLRILKEEGADQVGGVIHCFSEDKPFAASVLDLGFYISFSGILTFKTATEIQAVAKWMPSDRLLVETDSPYLAPVPYRGKTNEPAYVKHVAAALATLRGIREEDVAALTTQNLESLCGWRPAC